MKHFWINIDRCDQRNKFMTKQFELNSLEHYRVRAITPDDFDNVLEQQRPLTCKWPGCTTCEYEFACICSHLKAMQEGIKSGDEYFAILEDDIFLPFVIDYDKLLADIPADTEVLQMLILFGNTVSSLYEHYRKSGNLLIKWKYLLPSAGFYIISRQGAQKLVEQFYNPSTNKFDFSSSPYQIVADVLIYETLRTYSTTLPYAVPNSKLGSEIHPDHIPAHEKSIDVINKVISQNNHHRFPYVVSTSKK